jgi:hypothetical protein
MKAVNFISSEQNDLIMKNNLLVLLALTLGCSCFAQYTVTKVVGHVTNKTSGESLRPGSKLRDEDLLAFSSPGDLLRVIVSGKGIYIISPGPHSEQQQHVIVDMLKSALKMKSKEGYLSGRSDEDELVPGVLQTNAAVNDKNLLGPENKYLFDPHTYRLSNGNRFFVQTEISGSKTVISPLKTVADTLYLYPADFGNGQAAYKIGFFSREKNSSQLLATIRPVADTSGEMETIMRLIIAENKQMDKTLLQRSCFDEVYESLGKPAMILFNEVFNKLLNEMENKKN